MSVWKWPVVTAASSAAALGIGLFFDGWVDVLCWIGLGIPVVQSIWYWKLSPRVPERVLIAKQRNHQM